MPVCLLAAVIALAAPSGGPVRYAPADPALASALNQAWRALGPPAPWPQAAQPPSTPPHAQLVERDGGLVLRLYRPGTGRLIAQRLTLPRDASVAALTDALRLQIDFLRDSPPHAGRPWPPGPTGPPPIPMDPPWPADLAAELERPPVQYPPLHTSPVPAPPTPWSNPAPKVVQSEAPPGAPGGDRGMWIGALTLADPGLAAGFDLGLDWPLSPRWRLRGRVTASPFDQLGNDPVLRAQVAAGASFGLGPPGAPAFALAELGFEQAWAEVPGTTLGPSGRPTLALGLGARLFQAGAASLVGEVAAALAPWELAGRDARSEAQTLRRMLGLRAGLAARFAF